MIVGKIWDSDYPWDVRVEKVCAALAAAGHEVHLICRNRKARPERERLGELEIHRMAHRPGWPAKLEVASSFPAFVNPRWHGLTERVLRQIDADVVLCRDLPLAPMALAVARKLRIPVVVDIAEHYPGLLKDLYNLHDFRPQNLLIRNPWLAALVEKATLPRVDAVLVVVEEMGERLVEMGVPADRITLVSNTPTDVRVSRMAVKPAPRDPAAPLRLVYLGNVERSRGLHVALEGIAAARNQVAQPVTLDVFGDGSSFDADRQLSASLGLQDRVTFHGRMPYDEILVQLPGFDAGVIPHHATDHWNWTIQNKLFDYWSAGLPVVVSSMKAGGRIVKEAGAGVVFRDRDPQDFAAALQRLGDAENRRRLGEAGRNAVETRYRWELDARRLVAAMERVVG